MTASRRPSLSTFAGLVAGAWFSVFNISIWVEWLPRNGLSNDFVLYYRTEALIGLHRGWSHIYELAAAAPYFTPYTRMPLGSATRPGVPVIDAWAALPFALLPPWPGYILWAACGAALFLLTWWLAAPGKGAVKLAHLLLLVAIFPPAFSIQLGQIVPFALFPVALSWWLLRRDRPVAAGLVLSLVALKPQIGFLVPLALLFCAPRRAFGAWLLATAALALASIVVVGAAGTWDLLRIMAGAVGDRGGLALGLTAGPAGYLLSAAAAAAALLAAWRWRRQGPEVPFAAALAGSLLAAPYIHNPDLAALLLAAWLYLRTSPGLGPRLWLGFGLIAVEVEYRPVGPIPAQVFMAGWLLILAALRPAGSSANDGERDDVVVKDREALPALD